MAVDSTVITGGAGETTAERFSKYALYAAVAGGALFAAVRLAQSRNLPSRARAGALDAEGNASTVDTLYVPVTNTYINSVSDAYNTTIDDRDTINHAPPVVIVRPPVVVVPGPIPAPGPVVPKPGPPTVPTPPAATWPQYYTTVRGDYLRKIAKAFYGNEMKWPLIWRANYNKIGGNPDLIYPNVRLVIPAP